MAPQFLSKYYRPWSLRWILQRFILVIRQGSLLKVSFKTLVNDYKVSRNTEKELEKFRLQGQGSNVTGENIFQNHERIITCQQLSPENLSSLNHYFDHIYVLNLLRRDDRKQEMIKKLTGLNIRAEFFPATDGADAENLKEFSDYYQAPIDPEHAHAMETRLKRKAIYSPGAWGTLKSYRNLLREATEKGYEKILCLEDDVIFAKNFEELFLRTGKMIPENWKILYLGASQHSWEESTDLDTPPENPEEAGPVHYYLPLNTDGAFAIGIRRSAFSFLLSEIEKMNCSFDSGPLRNATKAFRGECFVLKPNLVIADVSRSDIMTGRKQGDFAKIVRWDLSLYDINGEQE